MLTCPLCKKMVFSYHKKSHLIPEWMYKDIYDENHKMISVDLDNKKLNKHTQQGYYHSIICKECEFESQKYDDYGCRILTDRTPNSTEYQSIRKENFSGIVKGKEIKFSDWSNINFKKFQNFIFICILRTHFFLKTENKYLLVDKHLKKIIDLYRSDFVIDDNTYPLLIIRYREEDKFKKVSTPPYRNKIGGHHQVEFSGGGFFFQVYVSSHRKPEWVYNSRLTRNGSCRILESNVKGIGSLRKSIEIMKSL